MNYGFYVSTSGALVHMQRQDTFSNNLANIGTTGFKRMFSDVINRDPEAIENHMGLDVKNDLLDKIGGGVFSYPTRTAFGQGAITETTNKLDMALVGEGFFKVRARDENGQQQTYLTRDGRFTADRRGRVVGVFNGHQLLDESNTPIRVDRSSPVVVNERGEVWQNNEVIAKIAVVNVQDPSSMRKLGKDLYVPQADAEMSPAPANVFQGWLESSNVNPINELLAVTGAGRAASSNLRMIRYHDEIMQQATSTLGRFSG